MWFVDPIDCFEALNAIIEVWELFDALPAKVRECFENDPEEMLECLNYEDKYFNNLENPSKSVSLASQILKTETKIRAIMMRIFVQRKRLKLASKKTEDFRKEELA